MKKILLIPLMVCLLLVVFAIYPSAEQDYGYRMQSDGENGVLMKNNEIIGRGRVDELLPLVPGGETVYFNNYEAEGIITLNQSLKLSGKLTCEGISVAEGANITLANLELKLRSGIENRGTLTLSDSPVLSTSFSAITNKGKLSLDADSILGGLVYSIVTDRAIYLPDGCRTSISIQYLDTFKKGSETPLIFTGTSLITVSSVYDVNGREYSLTRAEGGNGDEVYSVRLPYRVKFYADSALLYTKEFFEGEPIGFGDYEPPLGFVNRGWYDLSDPNLRPILGTGVYSDMELSADLALLAPEYTLDGVDITYDGKTHYLSFTSVSHPALSRGELSYSWMDSTGAELTRAKSLPILNRADSGSYRCRLTLVVGRYTATVITDPVSVNIRKARVCVLSPLSIGDVIFGEIPNPSIITDYGTAVFEYSDKLYGNYTTDAPTSVGVYYVRARVDEGDNHLSLLTDPISFSITLDSAVSIWIEKCPDRLDYLSFDTFDPTGMVIGVRYSSGSCGYADISALDFTYPSANSFRYGDGWIGIGYLGLNITLPVTVSRCQYTDLPEFLGVTLTYNGRYRTLSAPSDMPVGKDGISLGCYVEGGGTEAGQYTVTLSFYSQSTEYLTPPSVSVTLTVLPCIRELSWQTEGFVYDGALKKPTATYIDVFGVERSARVEGGCINANPAATAYAPEERNYTFSNPEVTFKVEKADYDMSGVRFELSEFIYDNTVKRLSITGLPSGVSVASSSGESGVRAGDYMASYTFSYDKNNYNEPFLAPFAWSIAPTEYSLGSFKLTDGVFEYDGGEKFPIITGELERGLDGTVPSWEISRGAVNVAEGAVTVTVSFTSQSPNYLPPSPISATVTVVPKGITVEWTEVSLVYNGKEQMPTAHSSLAPISVRGGGVDVGEYTAYAESLDPNFTVLNEGEAFRIEKADNLFTTAPSCIDIYFGHDPKLDGEALFGIPRAEFFRDALLKEPVKMPLTVGTVYCRLVVDGTNNYTPLVSDVMSFTVLANDPTSISVKPGDKPLRAYGSVTPEHFTALVTFSDGGVRDMSEECLVELDCEQLTVGTVSLRISYCGLTAVLDCDVIRADFDLSSLCWANTCLEYNGQIQYPTLTGLPEGLRLVGFSGVDSGEVGSYTVTALLEYDTDNYNPPQKLTAQFSVVKRRITPTPLPHAVYDGQMHTPVIDSELYYIVGEPSFKNAGAYTVTLGITDPERYELTSDTLEMVIEKCPVTVKASDIELFLLEDIPELSYTVTEGLIIDREAKITLTLQGEVIRINAVGDNYEFTLIDGKLIRRNTLSPEVTRATLICIFILVILVLLFLIIRNNRHSLRLAFAKKPKRSEPSPPSPPSGTLMSVDAAKANSLISDSLAGTLLRSSSIPVSTDGSGSVSVSVSRISAAFTTSDRIDLNSMKDKGLIPPDTLRVKIIGDGFIDKALKIRANDFDSTAIKMIALTGGEAIKTKSVRL